MALLGAWLTLFLQRHPVLLRHLLWLANAIVPAGVARLVVRGASVREVFARPDDFLMGYGNAPKLKLGQFLLGMDRGPRHTLEKTALITALDAGLAALPAIVSRESETVAARWPANAGSLDLAAGYAEPVFVRSLAHYFGLRADNAGPSQCLDTQDGEQTLALYIRTLGATIGSSHPAPFGLERLAKDVAGEFDQYLRAEIAERQAGNGCVIDRLLAIQQTGADFPRTTDDLVRSVGGMLAAGAGFPKAFANAVHELLRHEQMGNLHAAVAKRDERLVQAYVREALRFRPVFPMLVRFCPRATRIGDGGAAHPHIDVAAGASLAFFPLAAMFDSARIERPDDFIVGRPADAYDLFGGAPRSCIAEELIMKFFLPMFEVLFRVVPEMLDGSLPPGRFRHDGAGLESYRLFVRAHAAGQELPQRTNGAGGGGESDLDRRPAAAAAAQASLRCPFHAGLNEGPPSTQPVVGKPGFRA